MSSEESTAPAGRDGPDAPGNGPDATPPETADAADGKASKKAKKAKAPKEPKPPKAKKEKAPKEPKAAKEPKPPKEPKAKKEKAPKEPKAGKEPKAPKVKKPRRARKGGDAVDPVADAADGDDLEVGWSTAGDELAGDAPTDGADADTDTPDAGSPAKRRTLVGAAAIGPLLLLGALFLPTDRGRNGGTAMAAPATVPVGEPGGEGPEATGPEDTTPRFLVTVEQDLPATTTIAYEPTTTVVGHDMAGHDTAGHASTSAHEAAGHEGGEGATASTAKRSSTRTTAPPPFVVTQFEREDTQLAVFLLLDGRKIELAVPVRYFNLVSVSDPAQQTYDKEVAGHLLVVDRDGRYWGADLDAVPALLYQLPSSKPLEAPTTTAPAHADGTPHGTTTTIHDGGHPATGTTVHESTVHEDAEVAVVAPGSTEHEADHATDHATTTEGHATVGAESSHDAESSHEAESSHAEGSHEAEGSHADEEALDEPTTTTRVREPFPLVVKGPVSDEDERVVRLLAALPGVTSVLDLGRGAVLVEGDVDLEAILNVPGVLAAQPSGAG